MKISRKGLDELIKPHEGYLARQKDGSCRAYKCPAGVWTCGWGCTEGVDAHTHWTLEQATEALAVEMEQHEAHIRRLVKVPLNQGQFDALVSLCYNVGPGAIGKSDLLKHLNAGDFPRAASHFADFKYARVQGATATRMKVKPGTSVVLPGLVERRAAETSFFLAADPVIDAMPQKVEPPPTKLKAADVLKKVVAPVGTVGTAVGGIVSQGLPSVPDVATKSIENATAWKAIGKSVYGLGLEVASLPWAFLAVAGVAGAVLAFLKLRERGNVQAD